ncbi:ABC transporter ATP-binding protein [Desulfobulbus oligotrophicus]|jgi:lipoprotein-releasing system ATP-binding protein|uniref:ABC transporter ATP-binding protein n=1 Tax=Desulfobulbus oligotrophicus TaxID=1909699 RepID=A0A7T6ARN9_9BACT|nr:ABC transporter ATP-binding protein [Desulfobulbus oligotrophicus]MDY0390675.1 ABC transporter ATP-binding protein [Desulfobulbus oligotrophicus]QQG66725.1 ABC transporter ATP-binding protein [Desulfobulbus oligotrophicus]
MNDTPLLQAVDLRKTYPSGRDTITVLNKVNLTVQPGEMTAIVGASGSGKTTLLQILGTLDTADSGTLLFQGVELSGKNESDLAEHRNRHLGFIFQFHHLLPEFSALENVMMPGLIHGRSHAELRKAAVGLLERVGLAKRLEHRSGELSGGEQQRVALARALIMSPALLLADEPTGNLDAASGQRVFELLQELSDHLHLAVVMVTHNMSLAGAMDHCLTLADGRLCSTA